MTYTGPERRKQDRPETPSPVRRRAVRGLVVFVALGAAVALLAGGLALIWVQSYAQNTDDRLGRLEADLEQRRAQRDAERDSILAQIQQERSRSRVAFCALLAGLPDDHSDLVVAIRREYCPRPLTQH